jgi:hypothetical protein
MEQSFIGAFVKRSKRDRYRECVSNPLVAEPFRKGTML